MMQTVTDWRAIAAAAGIAAVLTIASSPTARTGLLVGAVTVLQYVEKAPRPD